MGLGGQRHAPAALPPGKTQYPLCRCALEAVWMGAENLTDTGVGTPIRPARTESPSRPTTLCKHTHTHTRISLTWNNKMHCFLLICFNSQPLHVLSRLAAHHQEDKLCINSNWYSYVDWQLPAASQHNSWLYQLLFIHSWPSWWWAASLLETWRGLLLK